MCPLGEGTEEHDLAGLVELELGLALVEDLDLEVPGTRALRWGYYKLRTRVNSGCRVISRLLLKLDTFVLGQSLFWVFIHRD